MRSQYVATAGSKTTPDACYQSVESMICLALYMILDCPGKASSWKMAANGENWPTVTVMHNRKYLKR